MQQNQSSRKRWILGVIFAIISALTFGVMPLMTKGLYFAGFTLANIVFHRLWTVALMLFVFIKIKGYSLKIPFKTIPFLFLLTFMGMVFTPMLLLGSYKYIPSGIATTLHFLYPVTVSAMSVIFLKHKMNKIKLFGLALATLGLILFADFSGEINMKGVALAFLSAITYSVYIVVMGSNAVLKIKEVVIAFYICIIGVFVTALQIVFTEKFIFPSNGGEWFSIIMFSFLVGIGGGVLFQMGVARTGPQTASIVSAFEPITSLVVGVTILHETLRLKSVVGVLFIITAVLLVIVSESRRAKT